MSKRISPQIVVAGALLLLVVGGFYIGLRKTPPETPEPAPEKTAMGTPVPSPSPGAAAPDATGKTFRAADIPGRASAFTFSATIPAHWQVEAVPQSEALNIYDPSAAGATNLEKSQIFIRYFRANQFLTLSTVNILERIEHTVNGRPAVTYIIEKKSGVPSFPSQPSWRNQKHRVTDIRVSDQNPSVFYVFAKRPELADQVFEKFLEPLNLNPESATLFYPIANFLTGITKKPFGIFITPENATARRGGADDGALATEDSPVQPERFHGYHTGVDIETPDAGVGSVPTPADESIPIFAITDGRVVLSQNASGYGGVLVMRHSVGGENILAIYGHLNPATMAKAGTEVKRGQQIGTLGKGFSPETDFERKHLHFGIYRGTDNNIKGYVSNKSDLAQWYDPLKFLGNLSPTNH